MAILWLSGGMVVPPSLNTCLPCLHPFISPTVPCPLHTCDHSPNHPLTIRLLSFLTHTVSTLFVTAELYLGLPWCSCISALQFCFVATPFCKVCIFGLCLVLWKVFIFGLPDTELLLCVKLSIFGTYDLLHASSYMFGYKHSFLLINPYLNYTLACGSAFGFCLSANRDTNNK